MATLLSGDSSQSRLGPDASAGLHRYGHRLGDGPDQSEVARLALPGPVQVDHVQEPGALAHPVLSHGHRVVAEHRLVGEVAPPQAHASAALDVDGGNEPHVSHATSPARRAKLR